MRKGVCSMRTTTMTSVLVACLCAVATPRAQGDNSVLPFTEEAVERGLIHWVDTPQLYGTYGFGSGFADLDNDGDPDAVLLGRTDLIVSVYENDGTGHFISRTFTCGIGSVPKQSAFSAADFDNDGDLDIFITQIGQTCRLYRNNGDWTFSVMTGPSLPTSNGVAKGSAWSDIDFDGDLDLHIAVYRNAGGAPMNIPSAMFRNDGGGVFTNISSTIPGFLDPAYSFTGTWTDIDLDGDQDLYVSNDRGSLPPFFQGNQLWRNDDGTFVEISSTSGAGVALFSMGLASGDFDGNGYPDFYTTNLPSPNQPLLGQNPLLLNHSDSIFTQGQVLWDVEVFASGWGCEMFDANNDGTLDLYVNNQFATNNLFINPGSPPAVDYGILAGVPGSRNYSWCSSVADIDGDGDLDLLVGDLGSNALLYVNHSESVNHALKVRPVGEATNRFAVGGWAHVWLDQSSSPIFRDVWSGGRSYLGHTTTDMHIGLGSRTALAQLEMHWPRGPAGNVVRTFRNLPAGGHWRLYPPSRLGDVDGDGAITAIDRATFDACFLEGFVEGCEMMDFDGDSDIDGADDFAFRHKASDFDGDGVVGPTDLGIMLGAWGVPNQLCDLDGSGAVGATDLGMLLGVWG